MLRESLLKILSGWMLFQPAHAVRVNSDFVLSPTIGTFYRKLCGWSGSFRFGKPTRCFQLSPAIQKSGISELPQSDQ